LKFHLKELTTWIKKKRMNGMTVPAPIVDAPAASVRQMLQVLVHRPLISVKDIISMLMLAQLMLT